VHCRSEDGFTLTPALLDAAIAGADRPVRALLFTSPSNPLGRIYTRGEIDEVVTWAEAHDIHVVFDEIYALSVYGEAAFTSVAAVRASLGDHIHVVWAFSKDFGLSGFRAGVLWSENRAVLEAVDSLSYWAAVSGYTQHVLGEMIEDVDWVDRYLAEMQSRLRTAHEATIAELAGAGIATVPSEAGIFVLCDLRPFLEEPTWGSEHRLWRRFVDEANVNLTPGAACHIGEPGWMRLCFASQPTSVVLEGVSRIRRVLGT
jgi:aspartate/methionine/tyrosine aminotransferase